MTVLSFAVTKGGVGKSAITLHTAILLAQNDVRVLVIDADDQANVSQALAPDEAFGGTSAAELYINRSQPQPSTTLIDGLDIMYATPELLDIDGISYNEIQKNATRSIRAIAEDYDLVLIDTPGSYSNRVKIAVAASDFVFIPLELDTFSLDALERTNALISKVMDVSNVTIGGIIPSRVHATNEDNIPIRITEQNAYAVLQNSFPDLLMHPIRERAAIRKAIADKVPLSEMGDDEALDDYVELVHQIMETINNG